MKGRDKQYMEKVGKSTQFGKGNDPSKAGKKGGRAQSLEKYLKEQFELELGLQFDKTSIFSTIEKMTLISTKALREIENNDDLPSTLSGVAIAILKDRKAGKISTLESIWDRVYGKSTENIRTENTTTFKIPQESVLNDDEKMLEIAEEIRRNRRKEK